MWNSYGGIRRVAALAVTRSERRSLLLVCQTRRPTTRHKTTEAKEENSLYEQFPSMSRSFRSIDSLLRDGLYLRERPDWKAISSSLASNSVPEEKEDSTLSSPPTNTRQSGVPFDRIQRQERRREESIRRLSRHVMTSLLCQVSAAGKHIRAHPSQSTADSAIATEIHPIQPQPHQIRAMSTEKGNSEGEPGAKQTSTKPQQLATARHEKLSFSKAMDKDFEKYLTGEMKPPVKDKDTTKVKDARMSRTNSFLHRDAGDKNEKLYATLLQQRKQKLLLKTSENVNRALMGNLLICMAKLGAYASSGSSAMLAEFWHSVVDCGNQGLLLLGLHDSQNSADRKHPYGYGKSVYFWALVSALGSFFMGAGISGANAVGDLMDPKLHEITWQVWSVLGFSLAVDGYVFWKTVLQVRRTKPKNLTLWNHLQRLRDPATLAILLEDGAACLGVVIALAGISATHATGDPIYDGAAGLGISVLLGSMGFALGRMNYRFLLGQAVDREITDDIAKILTSRHKIDGIGSIQSQWTGPDTFSYKAEVDFDGTSIAAELMTVRDYQNEFMKIKDSMDSELKILLALYAEDVMRAVEREVRSVEAAIRKKYPGAEYIELEPMSVDAHRLAIDDNFEAELRRVEGESLDRYLKSLREEEKLRREEAASVDDSSSSKSK